MKRSLLSYEDLFEEGEIIEEKVNLKENNKESSDEELEMGLKAVLPVGKFDEKFKEGQIPESGEEYLCTVRSERKKLENILSVKFEEGKGVKLNNLIKFGFNCEIIEVDKKWADEYFECLKKSEREFEIQLNNTNDDDDDGDDDDDVENDYFNLTSIELYEKLYETDEIVTNMRVLKMIKNSQELCEKLLNLHGKWLKNESEIRINLESVEILNKVVTWLQALIMCRDQRLTSLEISNLRQLCLVLIQHGEKIEIKEVIMSIVKKYGQIDLIKYK